MSDDILHQAPTAPAPSAEVVQPSTEAPQGVAEGTGASEQAAETEQQRQARASQAGRDLAEQRKRNQQNAFARLSKERDELQRALIEIASNRGGPAQPQAPIPGDDAPKRESFDSYEAWIEAKAEYRAEKKAGEAVMKRLQEVAAEAQKVQRQQEGHALVQQHVSRLEAFAKTNPDFDEVTARDDIVIPPFASQKIASMGNGPAILYAIGRDPSIAFELQRRDPADQALYLGELSASLRLRPPQVSQAPAPGTPVGGKSSAAPTLETADYDTFVKLRRAQIAKRNR